LHGGRLGTVVLDEGVHIRGEIRLDILGAPPLRWGIKIGLKTDKDLSPFSRNYT
jgi:hypothetical protein